MVDETKSTAKWQEKASKQLEKLNQDCNNTAGLEAVLKLAVGARVMLRRNIDVKMDWSSRSPFVQLPNRLPAAGSLTTS